MRRRRRRLLLGGNVGGVPTLQLSGAHTIAEDASVNDVIGLLSVINGSGTYTFQVLVDVDGKALIANDDELQLEALLDYLETPTFSVTIEADNGVDPALEQEFVITVLGLPGQLVLTGTSPSNDSTPPLTIEFPFDNGNDRDAAEGDELIILASDDNFATSDTYISHTLTAQDIIDIGNETPIALSGANPRTDGTWKFRGHLERGTLVGSDSADEEIAIDATAPTIESSVPADNAVDVAVDASIVITFSENIVAGAAAGIEIRKTSDDSLVEAFDETDFGGALTITGGTDLTINPTSDLDDGETEYYILIDEGSVEDAVGNPFAGISSTTALSFTTISGAFDPSSLFPANGGWWDVAASVADGTIYTDAGTTPATTDGELVYQLNDRSGNGNHLIQATSGKRPILRNSGAQWWLEFDGSDDSIKDTFTLGTPCTRISAFRQVSWTSGDAVWDGGSIFSMRLYQSGSSPNLVMRAGAIGPGNTGATIGTNRVVTEVCNGASSSNKVDNGTPTTGDIGASTPGGATIGALGDGNTGCANINWFGAIHIAGVMASGDQDACRTYFGNLAGLSL